MEQIVIKISDEDYKAIAKGYLPYGAIADAIRNGKALPKGHGDLIDRDSLEVDSDWSDYYDGFSAYSESQVWLAPTIIEGSESE